MEAGWRMAEKAMRLRSRARRRNGGRLDLNYPKNGRKKSELIGLRVATFDGRNYDYLMLRLKVIQNAPVASSVAERAIRAFEKLHVAVIRIVAHFRKGSIDLVQLGVGESAQLALGPITDHQAPIHASNR